MLALATIASAVPAKKGVKRVLTLQNGQTVTAELVGDEHFHYWRATEGDFNWNKLTQSYELINTEKLQVVADSARAAENSARARRAAKRRRIPIGGSHGKYEGSKRCLIILVNFKDTKFTQQVSTINQFVNGPMSALKKRTYTGTVKEYFEAQSNGQFSLEFDIKGPYTLSRNHDYYGEGTPQTGGEQNAYQMIQEAVRAVKGQVNFADYDWDDDGEVDQVYVMYAGFGQADTGIEDTVWPHESRLGTSRGVVIDGKTINTYACGSELQPTAAGAATFSGIGTLCHEFSHCLGLPDFYDTTQGANYGMGSFDLMNSGNYNNNSFTPPNYSVYEKMYAGWIAPEELKKAASIRGMKPQKEKYGDAYVIYNDEDRNEYYLLENRQKIAKDWDEFIPSSGLMIQHIDFDADIWRYNKVNAFTNGPTIKNDHQRGTIFHADNDATTKTEAFDLYPNAGNTALTDNSLPAAKLYRGTKGFMGKPITNITQNADGTISFDFMGGDTTGIDGITTAMTEQPSAIYSLDGVYMGTDITALPKGVYVVNGKKVVK